MEVGHMKTNQERMHKLLQLVSYQGGAELRLMETFPPQIRKHQSWVPLASNIPLTEEKIENLIGVILNDEEKEKLSQRTDFEYTYVLDDVGAFSIKFTPATHLGYMKEPMRVHIETISLNHFELVDDKNFEDFSVEDERKYLKRHEKDLFRFVGFGILNSQGEES